MHGYLVSVPDRVGAAAAIFEAAAARGVNISPAYGLADGSTGLILLGSDDEAGLQAAKLVAAVQRTTATTWAESFVAMLEAVKEPVTSSVRESR